jgi:hypothetical protein
MSQLSLKGISNDSHFSDFSPKRRGIRREKPVIKDGLFPSTSRYMANTRIVKPDAAQIDRPDWLILDALSDDYESVEQIVQLVNAPTEAWAEVTPLEVIDRLERLYNAGHVFLILDAKFDRDAMIREIEQTQDRKFWFGRTPSGDALWKKRSVDFCPQGWR